MAVSKKIDFIVLLMLIIVGIVLVNILGKEVSWDFANYHYYSVYALFHNRIGFDIMPCGIQSYLNPLLDIPYYFLVKFLNDYPRVLMSILSLYWSIASYMLYLIAKKFFVSKKNGLFFILFSTLVGATAFTPVLEIGTTWNDLPITIMIFLSLLIFADYLYKENCKKRTVMLSVAGLILGMAAGLKASAALFLFGTVLTLIFLCKTYQKPLKVIFLIIATSIAGYLLTNGWWMYILYSKFHNPYFPYYNDIFKSEYAPFLKFMDTRHMPRDIVEYLFYPLYFQVDNYVMENAPYIDLRFSLLLFAFIFVLIVQSHSFLKKSSFFEKLEQYINIRFLNFLSLLILFSYFYWVSTSGVLRYILPIEFLCGIYFSVILIYLGVVRNSFILPKIMAVVLIGLFAFTTKYPEQWRNKAPFIAPNGTQYKFLEIPDLQLPDNAVVCFLGGYPPPIFIPFQNPKAQFVYVFGENCGYEFKYNEKGKSDFHNLISNPDKKVYLLYSITGGGPINWDIVSEYINMDDFDCSQIKDFSLDGILDAEFYFCSAKNK